MRHFPVFMDLAGRQVVVAGGGSSALAKLRLLMKTDARITVFADDPGADLALLAIVGKVDLVRRQVRAEDLTGAALVYGASDDTDEDARTGALAREVGVLFNAVDNLEASDFITPAIVDRDPVTVAIATEGAAPVLARAIKRDLEERLPTSLGTLARIGQTFRRAAEALPSGRIRRDFWQAFYFTRGPRALAEGGPDAAQNELARLAEDFVRRRSVGHVDLAGAGPGDPELLTMKVRAALDAADVVIHDRLVSAEVLELARREALLIPVGKQGFGPSAPQSRINDLMVEHAAKGLHVVRLKSGDPTVFGRLDEEIDALSDAGVTWSVLPGITAASASVAALGQSMTRRGRNSSFRVLTGHDTHGFAEHDWRALARPGEVAAIYMGKKTARFVQGRLMMFGADPETPVTVIENASRPDQRIITSRLSDLATDLSNAGLAGPALIIHGLAPRRAIAAANAIKTQEFA